MTLPALDKTYTIQHTRLIPMWGDLVRNPSYFDTINEAFNRQQLLWTIKDKILNHWVGWTVKGSVDETGAGGMDAVDRWASYLNLKWNNNISPMSWIVLKLANAAGAGKDFELLLHLRSSSNADYITIGCSYAGFTGGSESARPTATDEYFPITGAAWNGVLGDNWAHLILTSWASSDGAVGRIMIQHWTQRNGSQQMTTIYIAAEKVKNPVSAWTHPFVFTWMPGTLTTFVNYPMFNSAVGFTHAYDSNLTPVACWFKPYWATESIPFNSSNQGGPLGTRSYQQVANSITGENNLTPIALISEWPGKKGRHGDLFDIWFGRNYSSANGTTFPSDASDTRIQIDSVVLPWDATLYESM